MKEEELVNVIISANGRECVCAMERARLGPDWTEGTMEGVEGSVWRFIAPEAWGPKPSELTGTEPFDVMLESFGTFCGSYERIPALLNLKSDPADPSKWFRLLGGEWEVCDNIGHFKDELLGRFENASRSLLDAMMTDEELDQWRALPDEITAFRGCSLENSDGMSFSLNREIAAGFPALARYYTPNPILIEARIPKEITVLKLGRDEFEIILTNPESATVVSMAPLA